MRSFVLVAALASTASATPMTVTGEVIDVRSHWTADQDRIVTEATVRTDTGDVVVSQLGGTVDGLTMRSFPGDDPLVQGMRVTVAVRPSMDLSQRMHNAVEGVKVLAYPPSYVRTGPTMAGNYLYWESGCVFVTVDSAGTKEIPGDTEFGIIDAAIASWNNGIAGCSYMKIVNDGKQAVEVGRDKVNVIKFRDSSWCRPETQDDPARCHPDSAAGITTATYVDDSGSDRDGAIVDADIELNGVHFAIAVNGNTQGTASCISELQNTLTHELGHLLGLEHTCRAAGDPPRVDDKGASVPLCTNANNDQQNATMFNFQDCGESKKASLEADDLAGACGVYPKGSDPGTCEKVDDGGGCCEASAGGNPAGPLALAGLVALLWLRRRRSIASWRVLARFWPPGR
jgi:MYXO-CTERM domain-containing protein